MFKVIRSSIEIAITPPQIARFRENLVQSSSQHIQYTTYVQGHRLKVKVRGSRSLRNVTYNRKRYKVAMDRLTVFNVGMCVVIKADNKDWRDVGRQQVAMQSKLSYF